MQTMDSVQIKEGKFTFKGKVELPEMYFLKIENTDGQVPVFLENSAITISMYADSLDKSLVQGSASHNLFKSFIKENEIFNLKMEEFYNAFVRSKEANDTLMAAKWEHTYDSVEAAQGVSTKQFILKNGKSTVAAYLALSNAYAYNLADLKEINKAFDSGIAASPYVKKLAERETILMKVEPGQPAPDFTMNDTTGKAFQLSSLKGSFVLVDFWASWCRPCRAENPNVVAAFNKFKGKGFTVLGVSLDSEREKWLKAIAADHLTWNHVSDLAGWKNQAAQLYGVMSIPGNFLLDKEGKIVAANLRGEALEQKLTELLMK
jgi:peroxiredoxin